MAKSKRISVRKSKKVKKRKSINIAGKQNVGGKKNNVNNINIKIGDKSKKDKEDDKRGSQPIVIHNTQPTPQVIQQPQVSFTPKAQMMFEPQKKAEPIIPKHVPVPEQEVKVPEFLKPKEKYEEHLKDAEEMEQHVEEYRKMVGSSSKDVDDSPQAHAEKPKKTKAELAEIRKQNLAKGAVTRAANAQRTKEQKAEAKEQKAEAKKQTLEEQKARHLHELKVAQDEAEKDVEKRVGKKPKVIKTPKVIDQ